MPWLVSVDIVLSLSSNIVDHVAVVAILLLDIDLLLKVPDGVVANIQ